MAVALSNGIADAMAAAHEFCVGDWGVFVSHFDVMHSVLGVELFGFFVVYICMIVDCVGNVRMGAIFLNRYISALIVVNAFFL